MNKPNTLFLVPFNVSISIFIISFLLTSFGNGGVLEIKGSNSDMSKYFSSEVNYILYNHGNVTPISYEYFILCDTFEKVGFLFLGIGLISLIVFLRNNTVLVNPFDFTYDHFFTIATKIYALILVFVWFSHSLIFPETNSEEEFLVYIKLTYLISASVGFVIALIIKGLNISTLKNE